MKFSKRSSFLTSSPLYVFSQKVKEKEALGADIISLGLGEPFYDTPEKIKLAGIEAIKNNQTHYNPATGSLELRKHLAEKHGVMIENISVSSGAKPFLGSVFWSLIDQGDVVFMAAPYYPPFYQIASSCGAEIELIETKTAGFKLTRNSLAKSFNKYKDCQRNFFLIINSPNNPTGTVYEKKELQEIVIFCEKNNITIISDECYVSLSADPKFSLRQFSEKIIVINSFSKSYAMTGWRVGYVVCPADLNVVIGRFLENYIGCPSSISDFAAIAALKTDALPDMAAQRNLIHAWLDEHNITYSKSEGGIFIFPDFSKIMEKNDLKNSIELATYFLEEAGVATTPGISFGDNYDSYLRISYCTEIEKLKMALDRMGRVI